MSTLLPLGLITGLMLILAQSCVGPARLPKIGAAPPFLLTTQDDKRLALSDLTGKVTLMTFIYTSCTDTCPILTAKLAQIQRRLGDDFGKRIYFLSVTVDPERDTREVLGAYAHAFHANPSGWSFLTGTPVEVAEVTGSYGIFVRKTPRGDINHTFLTSLIDRHGTLRVQYQGYHFDPEELFADIQGLIKEW